MDARLAAIADKFEIQELLTAYAHAIDRRDFESLDDIFTADAQIDYSATGGIAGGLDQIKPFLESTLPMFKASQHFVTNPLIKLNGDKATSRCLLLNPMTMERESGPIRCLSARGMLMSWCARTLAGALPSGPRSLPFSIINRGPSADRPDLVKRLKG